MKGSSSPNRTNCSISFGPHDCIASIIDDYLMNYHLCSPTSCTMPSTQQVLRCWGGVQTWVYKVKLGSCEVPVCIIWEFSFIWRYTGQCAAQPKFCPGQTHTCSAHFFWAFVQKLHKGITAADDLDTLGGLSNLLHHPIQKPPYSTLLCSMAF